MLWRGRGGPEHGHDVAGPDDGAFAVGGAPYLDVADGERARDQVVVVLPLKGVPVHGRCRAPCRHQHAQHTKLQQTKL